MTTKEHKKHHIELHKALDELVADWISTTKKLPSKTSILELMQWSCAQTKNPDKTYRPARSGSKKAT